MARLREQFGSAFLARGKCDTPTSIIRQTADAYLRRKLGGASYEHELREDVVSEAVLAVLERLREVQEDLAPPIEDLTSYVCRVAQAKFEDHLRKAKPHYWSVQGTIRYLCLRGIGVSAWDLGEFEVVGLDGVRQKRVDARRVGQLRVATVRRTGLEALLGPFNPRARTDILVRILRWMESPVPCDDLIQAVCAAQGLDQQAAILPEPDATQAPGPSPFDQLSMREQLSTVWRHVRALSLRHRQSLLFSMRGEQGQSIIWLLPLLRIADAGEIEEALGVENGELDELWIALPLSDEEIGRRLGLTAPQVSNLRFTARTTLARRLAKEDVIL